MRQLSADTQNIVQQLFQLSTTDRWGMIRQTEALIDPLFQELVNAKEPEAVVCVMRFLCGPNPSIRASARKTVYELMKGVRPSDLFGFSEAVCRSSGYYANKEWDTISPAEVALIAGPRTDAGYDLILGMLSFHCDGYVRHEALRQLAVIRDGRELPFLLIRLNDWVHPVARDARFAVEERIVPSYVASLVRCLPLILHLERCQRRHHQQTIYRVVELLFQDQNDAILLNSITESDAVTSHRFFQIGLQNPGEHQSRLVPLGVCSPISRIRLMCIRHLKTIYRGADLRSKFEQLSLDKSMPVRRQAMVEWSNQFPEDAAEIWKQAIFDVSRPIRELARFSLRSLGETENSIAAMYRQDVALNPNRLSSIQGLCETGEICDLNYFRSLMQHSWPSRRAAGGTGILNALKAKGIPEVQPLLGDVNSTVVRKISMAMGDDISQIAPADLVEIALNSPGDYARKYAIHLIAKLGKWRSISYLLAVAANAESLTSAIAQNRISRWFEPPYSYRIFTKPSAEERQKILAALMASEGRVSKDVLSSVSHGLNIFS